MRTCIKIQHIIVLPSTNSIYQSLFIVNHMFQSTYYTAYVTKCYIQVNKKNTLQPFSGSRLRLRNTALVVIVVGMLAHGIVQTSEIHIHYFNTK